MIPSDTTTTGTGNALSILVNGEPRRVPSGCTLEALLEDLGMREQRTAVAVNREVVARRECATHLLQDGDRIEILEAVGGG